MELLTSEQLAKFAKKYNHFVAGFLFCTFFSILGSITTAAMNQGENPVLTLLVLVLLPIITGLNVYIWVLAVTLGKISLSPKVKSSANYYVLLTIATFIMSFTPYANLCGILGLLAFSELLTFLVRCNKRFREHHARVGLFVHQKNLQTALFTEEEIQNAESLPRRTWGERLKGLSYGLVSVVILVLLFVGYAQFVENLPKTPTFETYLVAAQNGDAEAQCIVAEAFYTGEVVEKNDKTAFSWAKKSAEGGNARGLYDLSLCYQEGIGTTPNQEEANRYCKMAAEKNHPEAQCDLAIQLMLEGETETHEKEAIQWIQKAMDQNCAMAFYLMGTCLCEGTGVPRDEEKGKALIQKAEEMGFTP